MQNQAGLRHLVLCAFNDGISVQQLALLVREFGALKESIAEIRHFEYGVNSSPEGLNDGYTHCFTLIFDGARERDAYLVAAPHLRFVALLQPWLAKALVLDYLPAENAG